MSKELPYAILTDPHSSLELVRYNVTLPRKIQKELKFITSVLVSVLIVL
jgi:hypothetical protein